MFDSDIPLLYRAIFAAIANAVLVAQSASCEALAVESDASSPLAEAVPLDIVRFQEGLGVPHLNFELPVFQYILIFN